MDCDSNPGYPEDFWELKCKDNLIRDTMYPQELWKDPYHGLKRVEPSRKRLTDMVVPEGMIVAGGYAMYLAGWTSTYSDVDMFVIDKEKAEAYIASLGPVVRTTSCITHHLNGNRIQIILRHYRAPTEVVHGFDLDCCGVLWDGTCRDVSVLGKICRVPSLWATHRAIYAHKHHVNWFDPSRASPSYAYRLSKYSLRGYTIMLPGFEEDMVDHNRYESFHNQIRDKYLDMMVAKKFDGEDVDDTYGHKHVVANAMELTRHLVTSTRIKDMDLSRDEILDVACRAIIQHGHLNHRHSDTTDLEDPDPLKLGMMVYAIGRYVGSDISKGVYYLIPRDPVSILILAKFYNFHTGIWKQRDYDLSVGTDLESISSEEALTMIQWIEQNPMSQVSSTFYPTPIQDLHAWYLTSPLVKGYMPPPLKEPIPITYRRYNDE